MPPKLPELVKRARRLATERDVLATWAGLRPCWKDMMKPGSTTRKPLRSARR